MASAGEQHAEPTAELVPDGTEGVQDLVVVTRTRPWTMRHSPTGRARSRERISVSFSESDLV